MYKIHHFNQLTILKQGEIKSFLRIFCRYLSLPTITMFPLTLPMTRP